MTEQGVVDKLKLQGYTDKQIDPAIQEVKYNKIKEKKLFKNNQEKENLQKEVKQFIQKKMPEKQIQENLTKEGYTEEQITYIIEEIEPDTLFDSETDKVVLKEAVMNALDQGIDEDKIKQKAINEGWTIDQINKVIEEVQEPKLEDKLNKSELENKVE